MRGILGDGTCAGQAVGTKAPVENGLGSGLQDPRYPPVTEECIVKVTWGGGGGVTKEAAAAPQP